ncbi:MAG: amidohydrolase family protein [Oscillospiraceae bacterium]|jgi:guanine deaminase
MNTFVLHGDVIHAPAPSQLEMCPDSWLVCENGFCAGVFDELPERFSNLPVFDFGDMIIIPGYVDLHLHAPQYQNCGLGMDMELLDWLEAQTFPTEARFADVSYADAEYTRFVEDLARSATTRACVFGTIHRESTMLLMEKLEKSGLRSMVGKVSMDRNCPDDLREESPGAALESVESWLEETRGRFSNTAPIITPRFVPSCSNELMEGLGAVAGRYGLPVQSHLSENLSEVDWVLELCPDCPNYASVYDKFGLMGERTIMAHCVHLTEEEMDIMGERGAYVAHCPTSNVNIRSGIAPVRKFLDRGLKVGLGTDVSGGHTLDMAEVIRQALGLSKLLWRLGSEELRPLKTAEAFYLATRGGGSFFGRVGAFLPGFEFDAVVIDDRDISPGSGRDLERRFEKMIYLSSSRNVCAKFVAGSRLF